MYLDLGHLLQLIGKKWANMKQMVINSLSTEANEWETWEKIASVDRDFAGKMVHFSMIFDPIRSMGFERYI